MGVADRVEDIKALGVMAVMLLPITLGAPGLGPAGRAPVSFFAPEPAYSSQGDNYAAAREVKAMVRVLHAAGIEVILQAQSSFQVFSCWVKVCSRLYGTPGGKSCTLQSGRKHFWLSTWSVTVLASIPCAFHLAGVLFTASPRS